MNSNEIVNPNVNGQEYRFGAGETSLIERFNGSITVREMVVAFKDQVVGENGDRGLLNRLMAVANGAASIADRGLRFYEEENSVAAASIKNWDKMIQNTAKVAVYEMLADKDTRRHLFEDKSEGKTQFSAEVMDALHQVKKGELKWDVGQLKSEASDAVVGLAWLGYPDRADANFRFGNVTIKGLKEDYYALSRDFSNISLSKKLKVIFSIFGVGTPILMACTGAAGEPPAIVTEAPTDVDKPVDQLPPVDNVEPTKGAPATPQPLVALQEKGYGVKYNEQTGFFDISYNIQGAPTAVATSSVDGLKYSIDISNPTDANRKVVETTDWVLQYSEDGSKIVSIVAEVGNQAFVLDPSAPEVKWTQMPSGVWMVNGAPVRWNYEANEFEMVVSHWNQTEGVNLNNPAVIDFLNGGVVKVTQPGGKFDADKEIDWMAPEWWGSANGMSFAISQSAHPELANQFDFYENSVNVLFSSELELVDFGDWQVMVARGMTTYHKDDAGKLIPEQITTPLAVSKDGKFSLIFPLSFWNYRETGSATNFDELKEFWKSVADANGLIRSQVGAGVAAGKGESAHSADAYQAWIDNIYSYCSLSVQADSCDDGLNKVLLAEFLDEVEASGIMNAPAEMTDNAVLAVSNQSPIGVFADVGLLRSK